MESTAIISTVHSILPFSSSFPSSSVNRLPLSSSIIRFKLPKPSRTHCSCSRKRFERLEAIPTTKQVSSYNSSHDFGKNLYLSIQKPLTSALFYVAVGSFTLFLLPPPLHAIVPAPPVSSVDALKNETNKSKNDGNKEEKQIRHEFEEHTNRLLDTALVLLQRVEELKSGKGDWKSVEKALSAVKKKKAEIQGDLIGRMTEDMRVMWKEKAALAKRSEAVLDAGLAAVRERDGLSESKGKVDKVDNVKDTIKVLEGRIKDAEDEYNMILERIDDIDDVILRKQTRMGSIAARELAFVVKESELLVEKLKMSLKHESIKSRQQGPVGLSKNQIKEDLDSSWRKYVEQMILPQVIEVQDSEPIQDCSRNGFIHGIKQWFRDSRKLQKNLEARTRHNYKRYGDERRYIVKTPDEEILKGFPEVELKWMFGSKEIVVPKAARLHLLQGWKNWQEEAKTNLKKDLVHNTSRGTEYIAQRKESVLIDRDRLVSKTWYNDDKSRWEMDPVAIPSAVSKKLLQHAHIRHDWAAMYVTIKGDDKEYFVDIKLFDMLFEEFGGFDGLYVKLIASGIPTVVNFMRIPLSEMNLPQQFLLITTVAYQYLKELWNNEILSTGKRRVFSWIKNINNDILVMAVFPLLENIIPLPVRKCLGMAWPDEVDLFVGSSWYIKWQTEAEVSFRNRNTPGFRWFLMFLIKSAVYCYVLFHILHFFIRRVPSFLGYGPYRRDPNLRKLRRLKSYFNFKKRRVLRRIREGVDPIRSVFDQMKRVKNPPIRLSDFASVESMREEINEIVAFLQNPIAFQEMGARAPRGVLLVGERGTGKTSLAFAIAAEAKVPMVEVKARQLEAGLRVGQSAANVRELFQTARDLAPVIIFVEDFDQFAGVRGQFIHTKKQDHEAFINQLLVELDGFEKQDGVVLLATTRNLKQIDQALQRPGRMDRVLHLQRPTQLERERILLMAAKDTIDEEIIKFVDWSKVAEKTSLLRPLELKHVPLSLEGTAFRSKFLDTDELMTYCGWFASASSLFPSWLRGTPPIKMVSKWLVHHLGLTLTREDLESVVDLMEPYGQITNGIELMNPPLDWTREVKLPHAIWAAGRGLIALLLPNFDIVNNIWLEQRAWEGIGCTKITKARDEGSLYGNVETRSYLEKRLVFCFGSYIASQLLLPFGEENLLSSSELKQAQQIATQMVLQYGWGPDDSPVVYLSNNAVSTVSMGNDHEYEMAEKVEKTYNLAFDKAKDMIVKNRRVLEKIVEDLLTFENLTAEDLLKIIQKNGGILEQEPFSLTKRYSERRSGRLLDNGNGSSMNIEKVTV